MFRTSSQFAIKMFPEFELKEAAVRKENVLPAMANTSSSAAKTGKHQT